MTANQSDALARIIGSIVDAIEMPSPPQRAMLERLRQYAERLASHRFQLAVLGQFKRGKSTLLNAMIGHPLLATGILPLTAVPTFLADGPAPSITLTYLNGKIERKGALDLAELGREVAAVTTEEQNPENLRGIEKVDVSIPLNSLLGSVVLIDTPGIGSTQHRNTQAAEAVLPECDAALFVLSIDPPITDVELKYLTDVCLTVSQVIVVMNKIDLVDAVDQKRAISFLQNVMAEHAGPQVDPVIFAVSAKAALAARVTQDREGFIRSGLEFLERHIEKTLVERKAVLQEVSAAQNTRLIVADLQSDVEMTLRALALPLVELDKKIAVFESAVAEFTEEERSLTDLLSGEWRRTLSLLDALTSAAEQRVQAALRERLDEGLDPTAPEENQRAVVDATMSELFDRELGVVVNRIAEHIESTVATHARRYQDLIQGVRETVAALMQVANDTAPTEPALTVSREPYWSSRAFAESLGSVTRDWIARLLPRRIQQRRRLKIIRDAAFAAVGRNVSGMHWAMRQNIDDSFRRLLSTYQQSIRDSVDTTRDILSLARKRKQSADATVLGDIQRLWRTSATLKTSRAELDQLLMNLDSLKARKQPPSGISNEAVR